MQNLAIGQFTIDRLAELEDVPMPPNNMFPDATEAVLRAEQPRLGPRHIDASLTLLLSFNSFVVRTGKHTILVDACIGNDKERVERPHWHRRKGPFLDHLAGLGVAPEQVDFVLCTHLHADHVGWNTKLVNGQWVPTFPKAQYLFAEAEYAHWKRCHDASPGEPLMHGSFADSVLPVVRSGQATMVAMNHRVQAGVQLEPAVGHTPGNVVLHIEDGGGHAVLLGDVMHHPIQLAHPEWSTHFCFDAVQSRQTRRTLLERFAGSQTRLLTAHFQAPAPKRSNAVRVVRDGAAFGYVFD